jgi:putative flippase GtrA
MAWHGDKRLLEPVRFVLVGAVNTLLGLGIILASKFFLGLADVAANALGYAVGLTVSFVLNKRWTFGHSGAWRQSALRFLAAAAISYAVNLGVLLALIHWFQVDSYVAQGIAAAHYTVCFYLLSKFAVFRSNKTGLAQSADLL